MKINYLISFLRYITTLLLLALFSCQNKQQSKPEMKSYGNEQVQIIYSISDTITIDSLLARAEVLFKKGSLDSAKVLYIRAASISKFNDNRKALLYSCLGQLYKGISKNYF